MYKVDKKQQLDFPSQEITEDKNDFRFEGPCFCLGKMLDLNVYAIMQETDKFDQLIQILGEIRNFHKGETLYFPIIMVLYISKSTNSESESHDFIWDIRVGSKKCFLSRNDIVIGER